MKYQWEDPDKFWGKYKSGEIKVYEKYLIFLSKYKIIICNYTFNNPDLGFLRFKEIIKKKQ
ncbi:MAG TPA: hypothetical protein PLE45_10765 [Spirochaetota bacterium]|nr:hypothetical protein [Spirochaetota bacterium]HOL57632.1 hypothetical protein [Spirochaetota bacterium]HPP05181.1 hypothetical protein [Spirochaetota bacterium]